MRSLKSELAVLFIKNEEKEIFRPRQLPAAEQALSELQTRYGFLLQTHDVNHVYAHSLVGETTSLLR